MNQLDRLSTATGMDSANSPFVAMTPLHRLLVVGVLSAYLLWIGFQGMAQSESTHSELVLLALALNFALLLLPVIFYQPGFGWFHPLVFAIFLALVDHLSRSGIYVHGLQWHAALPGWSPESLNQLVAYELILSALGIAAIYLGFFLAPQLGIPRLTFYQPRHLGRKVLLAVLFATTICMVYLQMRGGIVSHILSWGRGRRTELAGDAYWGFFIQTGMMSCTTWLALDRDAVKRPQFWLCTIISLTIAFLYGGSRSAVIYNIVMGLMVWLLRERKISFTQPFIILLLSLFLLGILGAFRTSTFTGEINWGVFTGEGTTEEESALSRGAEEAALRAGEGNAVYPILAMVPEEVDYLYGNSYVAVLALPVPRTLWPEKPGLVGGRVGAIFFNRTAGLPPGPIGEAYWNFGVPGVFVVFLLFGMFQRWLADVFVHYARAPVAIVLYAIVLFQFSKPSSSGIEGLAITLALALLFIRLIGAIGVQPRQA